MRAEQGLWVGEGTRRAARDPRKRGRRGAGPHCGRGREEETDGPRSRPPRLTRRRFAWVAIVEAARPRGSGAPRWRFRRPGKGLSGAGLISPPRRHVTCVPESTRRPAQIKFAPAQITPPENVLLEPGCPQLGLEHGRSGPGRRTSVPPRAWF